jgi:hypothetical protein
MAHDWRLELSFSERLTATARMQVASYNVEVGYILVKLIFKAAPKHTRRHIQVRAPKTQRSMVKPPRRSAGEMRSLLCVRLGDVRCPWC